MFFKIPIFLISWGFVTFAAETASNSPDWFTYLLNGGPFAIVVLLIVLDKLSTPGERDRLRAENDALRAEMAVLNENIKKEIIPPLVQMNALMREILDEREVNRRLENKRGSSNHDDI